MHGIWFDLKLVCVFVRACVWGGRGVAEVHVS